jgi:hypothetical protein
MFETKVVEKSKLIILFNKFIPKSCGLWDNVDNFRTAGKATDGNMANSFARWIPKATNTVSENVTLIAFALLQLINVFFTEIQTLLFDTVFNFEAGSKIIKKKHDKISLIILESKWNLTDNRYRRKSQTN